MVMQPVADVKKKGVVGVITVPLFYNDHEIGYD